MHVRLCVSYGFTVKVIVPFFNLYVDKSVTIAYVRCCTVRICTYMYVYVRVCTCVCIPVYVCIRIRVCIVCAVLRVV